MIAFLCFLSSTLLLLTFICPFNVDPGGMIGFLVLVLCGLWIGFLERVVIIDKVRRSARIEYRIFSLPVCRKIETDLGNIDRIKVGEQRYHAIDTMDSFYQRKVLMIVDTMFPVWCMKGNEVIFIATGYKPLIKPQGDLFVYMTPFPNSAWFEDHSRFVASNIAAILQLPLEYEPLNKTFDANEINVEWLDRKRVRARLKWRKTS